MRRIVFKIGDKIGGEDIGSNGGGGCSNRVGVVVARAGLRRAPIQQLALEACLLAVAALVTLARPRWYRWRVSGTLGFIAAIGIWTRFTFALLAIPLGLRNLESSLRFRVYPLASSLLVTCVGVSSFVATAAVLISADTAYYHGGEALVDALNDPLNNMFNNVVVAPLNSLRYNRERRQPRDARSAPAWDAPR